MVEKNEEAEDDWVCHKNLSRSLVAMTTTCDVHSVVYTPNLTQQPTEPTRVRMLWWQRGCGIRAQMQNERVSGSKQHGGKVLVEMACWGWCFDDLQHGAWIGKMCNFPLQSLIHDLAFVRLFVHSPVVLVDNSVQELEYCKKSNKKEKEEHRVEII